MPLTLLRTLQSYYIIKLGTSSKPSVKLECLTTSLYDNAKQK